MIATAAASAACVTAASSRSAKRATEAITTTAPMIRINQTTGGTNPSASPISALPSLASLLIQSEPVVKGGGLFGVVDRDLFGGVLHRCDPRVHHRTPSAFPQRRPAVRDHLTRVADRLPLQFRAGPRAERARAGHLERGGRLLLGVGLGAAVALECDEETNARITM